MNTGDGGWSLSSLVDSVGEVATAAKNAVDTTLTGTTSTAVTSAKAKAGSGSVVSADGMLGQLAASDQTVHIFSVASGHLYEKLMAIMISSVRAHTKAKLKFWFIDTFLSPKFRAFVPTLAKAMDIEYDFISYKWPSWLNPQQEKQRLIWAYKILFLDVFFPLDVKRIMFLDSDQIIKADVLELYNYDLKGNVYGFVPMGNTNPATEGFRFWKQGYWAGHLKDKKYHISALFVVDLDLFRSRGVGDGLRGIYNTLSRDPNSLANLDQDLPNFAQHEFGIYSLPKEWLFCETWCDAKELGNAKTIDLCQNPLTKEPKLQMARRLAPEWVTYHDRIVELQAASVANETSSSTPVAVA